MEKFFIQKKIDQKPKNIVEQKKINRENRKLRKEWIDRIIESNKNFDKFLDAAIRAVIDFKASREKSNEENRQATSNEKSTVSGLGKHVVVFKIK